MKTAIIGGGNMGGAIADGLIRNNIVKACDVTVSHPRPWLSNAHPDMRTTRSNAEAASGADMVFIAVKPWLAEQVLDEIAPVINPARQIIASVAAGVTFDKIAAHLPKPTPVMFRIIPNTAIALGQSVTFIAPSANATDEQIEMLHTIFRALGSVYATDEQHIGAVTALASCGTAYALRYLDASTKAGIEAGVPQKDALKIVLDTMKGALALLDVNGTTPQTEIDKVTTPGGITLRGLDAMERNGFSNAVAEGIKASK